MARRDRRPRRETLSIRDHEYVRRQVERDQRRSDRPRPPQPRPQAEDPESALDRIGLALLLLRVFLGVTFVYAGLDKLIDPTFLRSAGPGSIAAQLAGFTRNSPVAVLIEVFAQPFPIVTGLAISIAEIAVGLGTLSGLLFRSSVIGGALLSILFWLTASWATMPYFYGPDLPYAAGWITLAIAGPGRRFLVEPWLARLVELEDPYDDAWSIGRRHFIEGGIIGLGALAIAAIGGTLGSTILSPLFRSPADAPSGPGAGVGQPSAGPGIGLGSSDPSPIAGASGTPTGPVVATVAKLDRQGSSAFLIPSSGDPGVVLKLSNGTFVAYDAVCTHAGCTVEFDSGQQVLFCPCHGATFDPAHHGAVLGGPTNTPLTQLPIRVDAKTGVITLSSQA
jgi:thiosulfate dehydrogenase [quinone] large subunit